VQATGIADNAITTAKLAGNAVTDAKVLLSTEAINSGKFGDERVAISTQAVSGGIYNAADKLVQLDANGKLPGLDGSALTGVIANLIAAANVQAGNLGSSVIVSSIAANAVKRRLNSVHGCR